MRAWTIQTDAAWQSCQATGILRADPPHIEPYFRDAYRWMADQMRLRLGPPPRGVAFPIWIWVQFESTRRCRPDLRRGGLLPRGEHGVLLTCDLPDQDVLLSDFVLWHFVLNDWYLPADPSDAQAFEAQCATAGVLTPPCQQQKIASWERIFDLAWPGPEQEYAAGSDERSIQGTVWEIQAPQITAIQRFTAR